MKTESLSFEDFSKLVESTPETTTVRSSKPSAPVSLSFEEFVNLPASAPDSSPKPAGETEVPQLPPDSDTAYGLNARGEGGDRKQPWDHPPIVQPEPPFMGGQRGYDEAGNKIEPPLVPPGVLEAASARRAAKKSAKAAEHEEILGRVRAGRDPRAILYPASATAQAPAPAPAPTPAPATAPAPVPPMEVVPSGTVAPRLGLGNATQVAREALAGQKQREEERSAFLESTSRLKPSVAVPAAPAPAPALQTVPKGYEFDMDGKVTYTNSAGNVSDLGTVKTNNQAYQMIADHQKRTRSLPVQPPAPASAPASTSGNTAEGMRQYVSRAPAESFGQGGPWKPSFEPRPSLGNLTTEEVGLRARAKLTSDRQKSAQARANRPKLTAEETQWPAGMNPKWTADSKGLRSGALEMYGKPFGRFNDPAEAFLAAEKHVYRSKTRTN